MAVVGRACAGTPARRKARALTTAQVWQKIYIVGMHHFIFEWDSTKSDSNLRKHGVSFEEAKTVFTDEFGRLIRDPDHSELGEDRFLLLDEYRSRLLVVCHCIRQEDRIRIISARKAEKRERKVYARDRHT